MKVAFAGTPEFAQAALLQLLQSGFNVPLVLTQPDRPAGRGMRLQASPVKQTALAHNIPVEQPRSLRLEGKYPQEAAQAQAALHAAQPDILVVAAYGLLLPQWVLDLPRLGCLNIHASLLPRWRGAAPIHRAIEAGDAHTGITLMQMDIGLDTGDILQMQSIPIAADDTTATLHDKLATLGAQMLVQALAQLQNSTLPRQPQPEQGVCYAHKIEKSEAQLDWTQAAATLERRIRAFNPFPIALTYAPGPTGKAEAIKIWGASLSPLARPKTARAGQVISVQQGIHIACGTDSDGGVLCLHTLQRAGGKPMPAADFLRGFHLPEDTLLCNNSAPAQ